MNKSDVEPCKTFEEFSHSHEVQLVGAIEHDTLDRHRFREILQTSPTTRGKLLKCKVRGGELHI